LRPAAGYGLFNYSIFWRLLTFTVKWCIISRVVAASAFEAVHRSGRKMVYPSSSSWDFFVERLW
jgi:hypothetical protein